MCSSYAVNMLISNTTNSFSLPYVKCKNVKFSFMSEYVPSEDGLVRRYSRRLVNRSDYSVARSMNGMLHSSNLLEIPQVSQRI